MRWVGEVEGRWVRVGGEGGEEWGKNMALMAVQLVQAVVQCRGRLCSAAALAAWPVEKGCGV